MLTSALIINGLKLMVGPKCVRWIAMPAKKPERGDASGKAVWDDYLELRDKATHDRCQDVILNLLRSEHSEGFDTLGAP